MLISKVVDLKESITHFVDGGWLIAAVGLPCIVEDSLEMRTRGHSVGDSVVNNT
jgi:hypothetical protein